MSKVINNDEFQEINSKEDYIKEFLEDLASKIGGASDGLKNAYLMRRLVESLSNGESKEPQSITNLIHFNNYKKNINLFLTNCLEQKAFEKDKKNIERTQKFINKELEKFKKEFIKDRDSYKKQVTKTNKYHNPKIKELQDKIEIMSSSTDGRVTRHIQKNVDKLNKLKKDHKEKLEKLDSNFNERRLKKFWSFHSYKVDENVRNVTNVGFITTNDSLNLNLTRKTIKSQYAKDVTEAYLRNIHHSSRGEIASSKMEMFDNPTTLSILKSQAYAKIKEEFEKKKFDRVSNRVFNKVFNYQKSILFSKEEKLQIRKDGLEDEIDKIFKKQIKEAINEFKSDNKHLRVIEENKAKDKENKKLEKENYELKKAKEEALRKEEETKRENEELKRKIELLEQNSKTNKVNQIKKDEIDKKVVSDKKSNEIDKKLKELDKKFDSKTKVNQIKKDDVSDKKVTPDKKVEIEDKEIKNIDEEGGDYGIDR